MNEVDEISKILEKVVGAYGPHDVFKDWLRLVEASLEAFPANLRPGYEDTPETQKLFEELREKYTKPQFELFTQAFALLLKTAGMYEDTLGRLYMSFASSNAKTGQFFTPLHIAWTMAEMSNIKGEVHQRLREAVEKNPQASALMIMLSMLPDELPDEDKERVFLSRVLPLILKDYEPVTVIDSSCGSGVMFLGAAKTMPWWMTQLGLVQFYGQDIDPVCVRIARCNIMLHGLNGHYAPMIWANLLGGAEPVMTEPVASNS